VKREKSSEQKRVGRASLTTAMQAAHELQFPGMTSGKENQGKLEGRKNRKSLKKFKAVPSVQRKRLNSRAPLEQRAFQSGDA